MAKKHTYFLCYGHVAVYNLRLVTLVNGNWTNPFHPSLQGLLFWHLPLFLFFSFLFFSFFFFLIMNPLLIGAAVEDAVVAAAYIWNIWLTCWTFPRDYSRERREEWRGQNSCLQIEMPILSGHSADHPCKNPPHPGHQFPHLLTRDTCCPLKTPAVVEEEKLYWLWILSYSTFYIVKGSIYIFIEFINISCDPRGLFYPA